jgi:hypothetical protein
MYLGQLGDAFGAKEGTNIVPMFPISEDLFTFWRESQVLLHQHDAGMRQAYRGRLRIWHPNLLLQSGDR